MTCYGVPRDIVREKRVRAIPFLPKPPAVGLGEGLEFRLMWFWEEEEKAKGLEGTK